MEYLKVGTASLEIKEKKGQFVPKSNPYFQFEESFIENIKIIEIGI